MWSTLLMALGLVMMVPKTRWRWGLDAEAIRPVLQEVYPPCSTGEENWEPAKLLRLVK